MEECFSRLEDRNLGLMLDILGPFGVGFSLGTLGWGPGIALFTVFGALAGYSGYLLWKMYLGLDS